LTFGSLFAGIGGLDLGLDRAGMICKWQIEIDLYCQGILAKHWPGVKRYGDVRTIRGSDIEPVDLICGGFPCQPHSTAGRRKGNGDERDLWPEYRRIIREIKPKWILAENVRGILSSNAGNFFGGILRDLAILGYDAEWFVLSACALGASHPRERVFIVAYSNGFRLRQEADKKPRPIIKAWDEEFLLKKERHTWLNPRNCRLDCRAGSAGSVFTPESAMDRMADGLPGQLDRLRCLGNAVVPQVAEYIGLAIIAADQKVGDLHGQTWTTTNPDEAQTPAWQSRSSEVAQGRAQAPTHRPCLSVLDAGGGEARLEIPRAEARNLGVIHRD